MKFLLADRSFKQVYYIAVVGYGDAFAVRPAFCRGEIEKISSISSIIDLDPALIMSRLDS